MWVHVFSKCHLCDFVSLSGLDIHLLLIQIKAIHTSGGLNTISVHVIFVTGKVAMGHVFLPLQITNLPMLHTHLS
jgi:hypothetical protein